MRQYDRLDVLVNNAGVFTPAKGAATSLHVGTSPEGGTSTGQYFARSRPKTASRAARDEAAQKRLWTLSEELLGTPRADVPATASATA